MKTASVWVPSTSSSEADPRHAGDEALRLRSALPRCPAQPSSVPPGRLRRVTAVLACVLLAAAGLAPGAFAKKDQIPHKVRMDVHWGDKKNREAYRIEMQRAVVTALADKDCFETILEGDDVKGDLVLEVQLNDFTTEQEYDSPEAMFPGQGEEHTLLSARVSVNLDFWLYPEGKGDVEILKGHFFREVLREPVSPTDQVEERALFALTTDAGRWVARDLCDRRSRLRSKVAEALAPPPAAGTGSR